LRSTPGVPATTLAALGSHQVTAVWDVAYAEDRRKVTETEQHVHGRLEQVPVMATALLLAVHWIRHARCCHPLAALFTAITGVIAVPYGNELGAVTSQRRQPKLRPDSGLFLSLAARLRSRGGR
jgi:hypothetical protein